MQQLSNFDGFHTLELVYKDGSLKHFGFPSTHDAISCMLDVYVYAWVKAAYVIRQQTGEIVSKAVKV